MDQVTFNKVRDEVLNECVKILGQGSKEYGGEDKLQNFKDAAKLLNTTPAHVGFIYLYKHIAGIAKYVTNGEAQRDSIRGRIVDAINYLVLLDAILSEQLREPLGNGSSNFADNVLSEKLRSQQTNKSFGATPHPNFGG